MLVVCVPLAYFRVGWMAGRRGTVWAEDGSIFLQQALTQGRLHSLLQPYAGYWHLVPRVLAAVVVQFPLSWHGVGMDAAASAVQASVALTAYVATRGYLAARSARAVLAVVVAALPVAPEVSDSVANLQWFLLFGAAIALLWTPRTRLGWALICIVVIAACGSGAFGLIVFGLVAVRAAIQFRRETLIVLGLATLTSVVQLAVILRAPPRVDGQKLHTEIHLQAMSSGYLRRVVGDGLLGWKHISRPDVHGMLVPALLGGALLIVAAACLARRRSRDELVPVAVLYLMSICFYAPIAVLSGVSSDYSDRYFVPGTLFFCAASVAMLTQALAVVRRARDVWTLGAGALSLGVLCVLAIGTVTSYHTGRANGRAADPGWSRGVGIARAQCQRKPDRAVVDIRISPLRPPWFVKLPCATIRTR
ncbi:MAG: hypothetical protein M3N95_10170 [Actinomycetota bacterium]|nr:hypothetical protein [Actinomycetota bacterium]